MSKEKKQPAKEVDERSMREPWLQKKKGLLVIGIVSVVMFVLVAYQIVKGSGQWGQAILWGLVVGGSIWLVFYGMTWFHTLFNKKK
ncbi:MAG: hypothetical protein WA110_02400 [Anaerolineaceae bacterium]